MELNREQIIKALECCASKGGCKKCPLQPKESLAICVTQISKNALAIIKELTEENKRLRAAVRTDMVLCRARGSGKTEFLRNTIRIRVDTIVADTVRKMQELFKERLDISVCGYSTEEVKSECFETLDQIAKEMLEDS